MQDPKDNQPVEESKQELPRHADRISMWVKDHKPHQKLPIVMIDNELIWLNRAQRRNKKSK